MKKLIPAAVLVAALFAGGYFVYSNYINPQPATQQNVASAQADNQAPLVMPTIVTVSLNQDGIPTSVGSLPLSKSEKGKQALDELAKMHGEGFDLVNGYRADYGGDQGKATLYVGQARSADDAKKLADDMATKIGPDNKMFTDLSPLTISGRTMYEVTGQGQLHFFYAINDKLVWLAIDPNLAMDGLHSIWGAIK